MTLLIGEFQLEHLLLLPFSTTDVGSRSISLISKSATNGTMEYDGKKESSLSLEDFLGAIMYRILALMYEYKYKTHMYI